MAIGLCYREGVLVALMSALLGCARPVAPVSPAAKNANVLVLVNRAIPESVRLGKYYAARRSVPNGNIVSVNTTKNDDVPREEYRARIEGAVRAAIARRGETVDTIVIAKGVPLRIRPGGASVDMALAGTELDQKGIEQPTPEQIQAAINPYFGKREPFSHRKFGTFLVGRLDGYDFVQARRLVDLSLKAKPNKGLFLFDEAANRNSKDSYGELQRAMETAAAELWSKGYEVLLDREKGFASPARPLAGYVSWGSNDAAFDAAAYRRLRFLPGAIAETFVSTSARTFSPTKGGQSLIADLIAGGVTGVKGYVSEPFTFGLVRPDVVFERYTAGFSMGESFAMATPVVKWKDVLIGDPLCRPYPRAW